MLHNTDGISGLASSGPRTQSKAVLWFSRLLSFCEDEGRTEQGKPLHQWWPPTSATKARTHHSVLKNAEDATEKQQAVSCDTL